ncbi:retrotransposon ORF1 [Tanacetum coccineum]
MENLNLFYQDIVPSSSARGHLTQEEATKEALAIRISQKFALLEEERPVIETMAYHDKYKKILDEIWKDKVELDGKTVKEDEEAAKRIKGEALKEKDDPGAFIFPIRLEGKVNKNALADTGSDINTMPYRIFEKLGREDMKKIDRGITMINHTQAEAMGKLHNVLCQVGTSGTHDGEAGSSRSKRPRQHKTVEELLLPQVHHEFLLWEGCSREAKSSLGDCEIDEEERSWDSERESNLPCALIYYRDLDTITLKDLIESEGKLIPKDPQPGVPRVGIPRPPRASMQDLYGRMGRIEICQDAIERMEYRQSYH